MKLPMCFVDVETCFVGIGKHGNCGLQMVHNEAGLRNHSCTSSEDQNGHLSKCRSRAFKWNKLLFYRVGLRPYTLDSVLELGCVPENLIDMEFKNS